MTSTAIIAKAAHPGEKLADSFYVSTVSIRNRVKDIKNREFIQS